MMNASPPPPGGGSEVPGVMVFQPPDDHEGNMLQPDSDNSDIEISECEHARLGRVLVDGLLCSIIRANSRALNENELIAAVERGHTEAEIK